MIRRYYLRLLRDQVTVKYEIAELLIFGCEKTLRCELLQLQDELLELKQEVVRTLFPRKCI